MDQDMSAQILRCLERRAPRQQGRTAQRQEAVFDQVLHVKAAVFASAETDGDVNAVGAEVGMAKVG